MVMSPIEEQYVLNEYGVLLGTLTVRYAQIFFREFYRIEFFFFIVVLIYFLVYFPFFYFHLYFYLSAHLFKHPFPIPSLQDYAGLVIQYGYTVLFVAAFPLGQCVIFKMLIIVFPTYYLALLLYGMHVFSMSYIFIDLVS